MKISYRWLQQYIDVKESPEQTGARLTGTGLEVESIEAFETVKGGLRGLVIGEVLTCAKHPNADKLSVTTVAVGTEKPASIVCGAANVAAGQKVVVALPGATLYPFKGEPFTIKEAKIRGELSQGMICAEDEIGLSANHAGIMVLNTTLPNGTPAATYFEIESDFVFEIGLTPNRADAASHLGVARDLRAVTGLPIQWPDVARFKTDNTALPVSVTVENSDACPRYSGVTISGVTVAASPAWLQNRLKAIGLTPINNVVDITNFVLHELAQPLHAFDADQIAGKKVVVKNLPKDTPFVTLDGKERKLAASDLMICNGAGEGMCIAGVFGGLHTGVSAETKNIFLESACFAPDSIRKTGIYHQLKTDASFRFERGTDPNLTVFALKRAALLIQEIAGGTVSSEIVDVYPKPIENRTLIVKEKNIERLIGKKIERARMLAILESLDINVLEQDPETFTVSIPPYRVDVVQEADIAEEILRIYGFNNIALSEIAGTDFLANFPTKDANKFRQAMGELLTGNGYYEILTNSLTNQAYQKKNPIAAPGEPVEILNKLSEEQGILRQTMLFTGLEVCAHNINRKQRDLKLFEFGKVYWKKDNHYHESEKLALFITGNWQAENWQQPTRAVTYHDLAQQIAHLLQRACLSVEQTELQADDVLAYGMALTAKQQPVGKLGEVKAGIARDLGVKQTVFYAELDVASLFAASQPAFRYKEVPKFPEVRRDLSLVLDQRVTFAQIEALARKTERKLVRDIIAFDVYQGDKIPAGKKAYALGFTLLDDSKTLTDDEIDQTMSKLMAAFEKEMAATIRK
jgi:phenylalanyl-tRNA synthetase beta chain